MRVVLSCAFFLALAACDGCGSSGGRPGVQPAGTNAVSGSAAPSDSSHAPPPAVASAMARAARVPPLPAGSTALTFDDASHLVRPGDERRMEVLSLGTEPRQVLRHTPERGKGPSMALNIDLKQRSRSNVDTSDAHVPNPVLNVVLSSQFGDDADKDGEVKHLQFTIVELTAHARDEAEEAVAKQMKDVIDATVGRHISVRFTEMDAYFETPEKVGESEKGVAPEVMQIVETVRDVVREMLVPLPKAELGLGARWRVMTRLRRMGIERVRVATYQIVRMDQAAVVLQVDARERAVASDPKSPALPDDVMLAVMGGEANTTLKMSRPRAKLLPTTLRGELRDWADMTMKPPPGVVVAKAPYRIEVSSHHLYTVRAAPSKEGSDR